MRAMAQSLNILNFWRTKVKFTQLGFTEHGAEMKSRKKSTKSYPKYTNDVPVTAKRLFGVRSELVSKFNSLEHRFEAFSQDVKGEVHRIALLVEDQNARNAIVMDGLTSLFERQERIETRLDGTK